MDSMSNLLWTQCAPKHDQKDTSVKKIHFEQLLSVVLLKHQATIYLLIDQHYLQSYCCSFGSDFIIVIYVKVGVKQDLTVHYELKL